MEIPANIYHNCSFCSYAFSTPTQLDSHIRKHTREKPFICDKCNRGFLSQYYLNVHVKNLHHPRPPKVETKKFKCSLCPYAGHSKANLERHMFDHTGVWRFHCPEPNCKYAAKTSAEIQRHNIHNHQNERKFKCPFPNCGYRGKSKRMVRSHYATHNDYKPFACDVEGCKYETKRKSSLEGHKLAVHHGGYKPFACSQCEFCTTNKRLLKQHGLTHTEDKPFKCDFSGCLYSTKFKANLNFHTQHRHKGKTFECEFESCSFVGSSERFLESHKKNVHSEKIHKCPCCHYRSAFPYRLKVHMENHNRSNSRHMSLCQNKSCTMHGKYAESERHNNGYDKQTTVCPRKDDKIDYAGSSRSDLQRNICAKDPTARLFHCLFCSKQFHKYVLLSKHLRIHTAEKSFSCPVCSYGSVYKNSLITHVRAVHSLVFPQFCYDEKSTCNHCQLNFGCAAGLAMHKIKLRTVAVVLTRLQLRGDL